MANFDKSNSNGRFTLRLTVTETATSTANNTSSLSYTLKLIANTGWNFELYKIGYAVKLNGVTVASCARSSSPSLSIQDYGTLTLCSGTYTVTHNSDGSLSMPVAFSIDMASLDYTPGPLSGSGAMSLTTIPRASTIGATSANIGEVSTITVNRKSSAFTHSIAYKFGSLSGYITASGGAISTETKIDATSIAFTVPPAFYAQIPSAKSGECTLTIKTYSGTTQVGGAQTCKFTATAAKSVCAPTVSGTVEDTNEATIALTGDANKLVRYYSNAYCTITAEAKNSAGIASKAIGGTAVSGNALTIEGVEKGKITFAATDSRGYTTEVDVSKQLIEYIELTATAVCTRDDPTSGAATLYVTGNYYRGSFGKKYNALSLKYRVGSSDDWISAEPTMVQFSGTGYKVSIPLTGMDYQRQFRIEVSVADALVLHNISTILSKGIPVADWGESGFRVNVPLYDKSGAEISLQAIMGAIYPVGSIVVRYDHIDPATLYGGTWERLPGVFLRGAGSNEIIGETGGGTLGNQLGVTGTAYGGIQGEGSGGYSSRIVVTEYGNNNPDVGFRSLSNMGVDVLPPYTQVSIWRRTA